VERPKDVVIKYLDYDGEEKILVSSEFSSNKKYRNGEVNNLLAVCVQHEIDHLNGITFVDHISKLKRELILKKVKKLSK
jgi:peptide deformylase